MACENSWFGKFQVSIIALGFKSMNFFVFRFVLFYYGTGQSGWSKKGGSDLVVMNEEALVKHKTRETKKKDLKRAIEEALKDKKTK